MHQAPYQTYYDQPPQAIGPKRTRRAVSSKVLAVFRKKNEKNSLVYRLPPDVLFLIASYLPNGSLINATHVSHRWRETLISFPTLWSDIRLFLEQASKFLERSKSTKISVFITTPKYPNPEGVFKFLAEHEGRIKSLTISDSTDVTLPPMPSLKNLNIPYYDQAQADSNPKRVFTFDALETLTVRGGDSFPFDAPSLTKLKVDSWGMLSRNELLDFLACCPLLEELEVDYDQELAPPTGCDTHDVVELPRLRFYSHSTREKEHLSLFDKLLFPLSCSVVFNYWNGPSNAHEPIESLEFCNPSTLADVTRVKLKTCGGDATVELIDEEGSRAHMVINVSLDGLDIGEEDGFFVNRSYASYLKDLDTHAVDVLCVEGPSAGIIDQAEDVLSQMDGIKTLVLSGSAARMYLLALVPEFEGETYPNRDGWRCLMLEKLVIHADDFIDSDGKELLQYLLRFTNKRKLGDMPLKFVSLFIRSPLGGMKDWSGDLDRLKKLGWEVEVRGGDDVLDWNIDNYFFDELDIRRDRELFQKQRDELRGGESGW